MTGQYRARDVELIEQGEDIARVAAEVVPRATLVRSAATREVDADHTAPAIDQAARDVLEVGEVADQPMHEHDRLAFAHVEVGHVAVDHFRMQSREWKRR